MVPLLRPLVAVAVALGLAACGADVRYDAAQDVQAFIAAARSGDRETFEAHIDRPALRADLRAQLGESLAARTRRSAASWNRPSTAAPWTG